ncbi:MAG: ROK family protein [Chlorobi bacterium]|nr:ROK family protein [Chlorobiota bacterium]
MKEIAIGIDIGGTNTVFGIVDKKGNIISKNSILTSGHNDLQTYINVLSTSIKDLLNNLKDEFIFKGIGIGAPNANFHTGTIEHAANLDWKGVLPFADIMKEHFDVPVYLTNDANAAALGEKIYGGAKYMDDFILITLGTGLGSGIFANGRLIYGHSGFAGELGHINAIPNGRLCGCGKKGCLETYVSAKGIVNNAIDFLNSTDEDSLLRDIENFTSKDIYEAALKNDIIALQVFDFTANILGISLADAVAILNPEAIFLFGGLANAGDFILQPAKEYMEENLLEVFKDKVEILPSQLEGGNAAILGASALVFTN